MKIQVKRAADDSVETLTLVPPVTIRLGGVLNILSDSSGVDHYFVAETGLYDGWGMAMPEGTNIAQAGNAIDRFEESREIHPGSS